MSPDGEALRRQVEAALRPAAAAYGLDAERLRADYVLNWGGFVNHSFRVSDGARALHVKLSGVAEDQAALARWRSLRALLEERYHAPPMLGWLTLPDTPFAGPVFAALDGHAPPRLAAGLLAELAPVLARLHADTGLAAALDPTGRPRPCRATYLGTLHERFTEDLAALMAAAAPPVSAAMLGWLAGEVERLMSTVAGLAAFDEPAGGPIHGDLWLDNLLAAPDGTWWLLDWDDLAVGDPALDWATLLGYGTANPRLEPWRGRVPPLPPDGPLAERIDVYIRATVLDWAIDPLADHIEADLAPAVADEVRPVKLAWHRAAVARYAERYAATAPPLS